MKGAIIFLLPKYIKNNDMLCENLGEYLGTTSWIQDITI